MTDAPDTPDASAAEELTGILEQRVVGAGSKSEMVAVVLRQDDPDADDVVLRRHDAAALDAEAALLHLVGRHVRVSGRRRWTTFVVEHVEPLDTPDDG